MIQKTFPIPQKPEYSKKGGRTLAAIALIVVPTALFLLFNI